VISPHVWDAWLPPKKQYAVEWIPENVWMPLGSEHDGQFDFALAPHTRGVLEAWDDPEVREITLCWATRNMKTSTLISLMIFAAACSPCAMAIGSCDENSIDRVIDEQLYPMMERCEATKHQLPPAHRRGKDMIRLKHCRIRKAFGGSAGSVAGYPAEIVAINEYSKWPRNKSSEADTARGFVQRVKGFPYTSKVIKESTPGEKSSCRVWADLHNATTDRREFNVPCPLCGEFQVLEFGDRDSLHGIKWEKPKTGHTDPLKAEATAYYSCKHCQGHILSEDRAAMMRRGVWLSEGQSINKQGKISGKRKVASNHIGFGPLSSLYSLLISGWGQIVKEFLACGNDPEKLRDFTNSTLAIVWDPKPKVLTTDQLADRVCVPGLRRGLCPDWSVFLTRGIDVQQQANFFVWDVVAWGPKGRGHVVDWGETFGADALIPILKSQIYPHADGGAPLSIARNFLDTGDGDMTEDLYRLCKILARTTPGKGSSHKFLQQYQESPLDDKGHKGMKLLIVNTHRSQNWLEGIFKGYSTDPTVGLTLPEDARIDTDYMEQLLNEVLLNGKWEETGPNHHRDALRYAWAIAQRLTKYGSVFETLQSRQAPILVAETDEPESSRPNFITSGGGRQWHQ
jgi:phage terminase large subunit GpA-like protein